MFQTKVVEKFKTHFTFNNFFFPENRAFYEIMVQPDVPRMTIQYGACASLHAG